jgi:hypothetical protein
LIHSIGELKLVKLKDQRIMQLLEQIEDLECSKRETREHTAQRCLEIANKHDCRCAADEISREFKLSNGGGH